MALMSWQTATGGRVDWEAQALSFLLSAVGDCSRLRMAEHSLPSGNTKGHMKTNILATLLMAAAMIGLNAAEMPKAGDKAPDFTAQDQDGNTVKLSDFSGKQTVLLYFYPKDNTPGCTKEACGFRDRLDSLKKSGVAVL